MQQTNNSSTKFDIIIPPQDISCAPGLQEKLASGDRNAFAWVYKNYCKKVFNYAMLVTNNEALSEDIVQDVFVKLWKQKEKIRHLENFNGYIYMLYRNEVMDALRNQNKENNVRIAYSHSLTITTNSVDVLIDDKETDRLLADAIQLLPKCRRQIVEMTLNNMEHAEIVRQLGIRPRTVWNQLNKARKFVKAKINNK